MELGARSDQRHGHGAEEQREDRNLRRVHRRIVKLVLRPRLPRCPPVLSVLLPARAGRQWPPVDLVRRGRVPSVFRPETFGGPSCRSRLLNAVIERSVAEVVDLSVEVLLPEGLGHPWLCWSGGSAVLGVDAVGGPPEGDFTDERGGQRSARRRPCGLGAVAENVVSDVVGKVRDQPGSLGQVATPQSG